MYYRLKDDYCLRGWELLPYAVVDSKTHRVHWLDKTKFDALTLCDGSVDFDLPLIPRAVRDSIGELEEKGYICELFRNGWLQKLEEKIAALRPTAECWELKHLSELQPLKS